MRLEYSCAGLPHRLGESAFCVVMCGAKSLNRRVKSVFLTRMTTQIGRACVLCGNVRRKVDKSAREIRPRHSDYHTDWERVHFVW